MLLVFKLNLPRKPNEIRRFGGLIGASLSLMVSETIEAYKGLVILLTENFHTAFQLENELRFFLPDRNKMPIMHFQDWETLPYDNFSPHQNIISQRLTTLYQLPHLKRGALIVPVSTIMHTLCPQSYLTQNTFIFNVGDQLSLEGMRLKLERIGYRFIEEEVKEHGEFSIQGSLLDLFPMRAEYPFRINLFDNEIDSIHYFNPETQRSIKAVNRIHLLPAREFPFTENSITLFRKQWHAQFDCISKHCPIYQNVSQQLLITGLEYYLPFFFNKTATLFDYFPKNCLIMMIGDVNQAAKTFWKEIQERYEQYRHNISSPLLTPKTLFIQPSNLFSKLKAFPQCNIQAESIQENIERENLKISSLPNLMIDTKLEKSLIKFEQLFKNFNGQVLICAESVGRREILGELFQKNNIHFLKCDSWPSYLKNKPELGLAIASIEKGMILESKQLAIIAEADLFGHHMIQQHRRKLQKTEINATVHHLVELTIGAPIVHLEHGIGRYLGLRKLTINKQEGEFVTIEYADKNKLYVPVSAIHLINRYSAINPEHAPLHHLGSDRFSKEKCKALEQMRDVAIELLAIYAKRNVQRGFAFKSPDARYYAFVAGFPFKETPDQKQAIEQVVKDLQQEKPMDRVICGDAGFGKTEVAMRAAFLSAINGKQVAILVPTTLLAQQHFQTFSDRFANFSINIDVISRFRSKKEQLFIDKNLEEGHCDIIIGTHKLLQTDINFKNLGLLIIDEEHRFGVLQKEQFKRLRSQVNILTLTATPIPRTLNMAISGIRDLSIIATPPAKRLAIKTFIREYNKSLIQEAILRELRRGGQVYYLHNAIKSIAKRTADIQSWFPSARIAIAHGQMAEHELKHIMSSFYHRHFNILVCTTIIETGIDIPTANTIVIERSDKLGLAQLYQLRGRVGRSHHQAYAFCLTPPHYSITQNAIKRLEAIESLDTLGVGFTLAKHDLEIRGAGDLLGKAQSGNVQSLGFHLYTELLNYAIKTLRADKNLDIDFILNKGIEIDLQIPAHIPEEYIPDMHTRLVLYKRIACAKNKHELDELKVEFIDRFGSLPESVYDLFDITILKLQCEQLGIKKIKTSIQSGKIEFTEKPMIDLKVILDMVQNNPSCYQIIGPRTIQFRKEFINKKQRLRFVDNLLKTLTYSK